MHDGGCIRTVLGAFFPCTEVGCLVTVDDAYSPCSEGGLYSSCAWSTFPMQSWWLYDYKNCAWRVFPVQ